MVRNTIHQNQQQNNILQTRMQKIRPHGTKSNIQQQIPETTPQKGMPRHRRIKPTQKTNTHSRIQCNTKRKKKTKNNLRCLFVYGE